jgi:hypothetical protein
MRSFALTQKNQKVKSFVFIDSPPLILRTRGYPRSHAWMMNDK